MMLPMKRSEVFKILSDVFSQSDIKSEMELNAIEMSESPTEPYDIDFHWETTGKLVSYLHIINPPKDCVDGKYYFEYRVQRTQKTGTIAIDSAGTIRVYSDDIDSFIYKAIKDNANQLADYAKKLTRTYHEQIADTVVSVVKTYCDTLMNKHASTFDQMDISVSEGYCTEFRIRSINEPERDHQFDVVEHIDEYNINDNDIWVRFSKPDGWLWTPIFIKPSIGDIVINTKQCVFTNIFGAKELVRLARLISERTGFEISVKDGGSARDKNVAKYIKSLLQKHEVIDTVKQASTEKDDFLSCDDVFQVVVDWLQAMSVSLRIKDATQINHLHHTVCVRNSIGYGADRHYVTEELKVSYASYMKSIQIYLNNTLIITIDDLGLGDTHTCVFINKYDFASFNTLNSYLIACLAEVLKDRLGMEKLRAYYSSESKYLELVHCGTIFFFNDRKTAYVIDPECVISKENIDKMNDENNKTFEQLIDSTIDKKITQLCDIAKRSAYYTTKEYQYSNICKQLTLWQQGIFHVIYSAIYCTLAESSYTGATLELENWFMQLVGTDKDQGFHVFFRLDKIHKDLPRFDIEFDQSDTFVRIQEGDWTKTCVLLNQNTDHAKVYTQNIRGMRDTYKTIVSQVASKIVLIDALS